MSHKNNCPKCGFFNSHLAKFCQECGLKLHAEEDKTTDKFINQPTDQLSKHSKIASKQPVDLKTREFSLYLADAQYTFRFPRYKKTMLGRNSQCVTPVDRVVDLSELINAKDFGISRRHAMIAYQDAKYTIQDLGSSNGTRINQLMLQPRKIYQIHNGDCILIGSLLVIFHCTEANTPPQLADTAVNGK